MAETLTPATRDAVLARLGFADRPPVDRSGLDAVYLAWCRTVPFDNLVKLVDLRTGTAPFRNDLPEDFFALFLAHGAGGTCWPSSRALAALLRSLGFELTLGSAAMGDELFGPVHSHGTIIATVGDEQLWVDTSMQTDLPVPLVPGAATALDHPLRPVRVEPVGDAWRVHWTTGTNPGELGCLLLDPDVTGAHYSARYEWSREMSPFNTLVMSTRPGEDEVVTVRGPARIVIDRNGHRDPEPLAPDELRSVLIDEHGYSEAIVDALPASALVRSD